MTSLDQFERVLRSLQAMPPSRAKDQSVNALLDIVRVQLPPALVPLWNILFASEEVESNDAFNTRDRFINVSILLRFFSVIQMAYFEGFIGGGRFENEPHRPAAADASPQLSWFMAPAGAEETRMGVKVSY